MYHPDGYMSAQILEPGQPAYGSPVLALATDAERAESTRRYMAYAGRFSIQEDGRGEWGKMVVVHHAEVSLFPNWVGATQRRSLKIEDEGATLVLRTEEEFPAFVSVCPNFTGTKFCIKDRLS